MLARTHQGPITQCCMRILSAQKLRFDWPCPRRRPRDNVDRDRSEYSLSGRHSSALRSSGRSIVEKGSVLMPCDKATYRTHRTKPTPKPANGAALRIMPLPGRMSSSHREFRKRALQLNACGQALRAAQCAATGNAAKKDNQPKTFGAPRPTRGRPQCDVFTRSLRTLWTLLCRYRGSGACRCQPGRPSTQLQQSPTK